MPRNQATKQRDKTPIKMGNRKQATATTGKPVTSDGATTYRPSRGPDQEQPPNNQHTLNTRQLRPPQTQQKKRKRKPHLSQAPTRPQTRAPRRHPGSLKPNRRRNLSRRNDPDPARQRSHKAESRGARGRVPYPGGRPARPNE